MPAMLFTFYPCRADGSAVAFEALELADDATALARARAVLADHASAVEVVVWQGERRVGVIVREATPA
jgi:hypothetical protein